MAAIVDHKASSWRLSWNITLLAPLYCGVVVFGITVYVQTLVIQQKGPVFLTPSRPLSTVLVAILGLLILGEALYLGRNNQSKVSATVLRDIFFLGILGPLLGRTLFFAGLELTSSTFASAFANIIPSATFILAIICRMEKVDIYKRSAKAKIGGTIVAFAGVTLMTLYKGIIVISFHSQNSAQTATSKAVFDKDWIKSSVMPLISFISLSANFVLQTAIIKKYPAPLALMSLTCFVGTLLATIMTAILDHKASSWMLHWNITLLGPLYCGVMVFGITAYIQTLVMQQKGPVFVTASRPLTTVIVVIVGLPILGEALYLGSIVGTILIILGLYAIASGKEKDRQKKSLPQHTVSNQHIEIKPDKQ